VSGKEVLEKLCGRGDWMAAKVRHDSVLGLLEDVEACGGADLVAKALIKAEGVDGYLLYRFGDSFGNVGKLSEAIALFEEARGIKARTVGKEMESYAVALLNLGVISGQQGDLHRSATWRTPLPFTSELVSQCPPAGKSIFSASKSN
jgi:hypothetical protein